MVNHIMFREGHQKSKAMFQVLGLLCFTLFVQKSCAREFKIGGSKGWSVLSDDTQQSYNQWAEKSRFQIGDSIVFVYPAGQDSVLLVSQDDYTNCNTDKPEQKFDDGHTVFTFSRSGAHHFISGNKDNCLKNEKVAVVVMADRTNRSSNSNQTNPASPPSPGSEGTTPSPAPSGEESPPPPTGTDEINPTSAPVSEPPPPSAASSAYISFLGCIGAFAASSFVLAF